MSDSKPSDFRYNTGETQVPWAAVGENYNAQDVLDVVKFLIRKDKDGYDEVLQKLAENVNELIKYGKAPGKLSLGDHVSNLESKVKEYLKAKYCIFITNATAGFEIGLRYANVGPGDEVIVPAITFAATMAYSLGTGAKVVFVDVDPRTINMDPKDVERKITDKTKAIIPVHIGGWPVDMDPIMELAEENDIVVIEDAAHAFGASYKGRKAGTIGHFGSYSFHEVKNITSFGEGGVLVTDMPFGEDLPKARFLGLDFSRQIKNWLYDVSALQGKHGYFVAQNSSSTEIQALGLMRQFSRMDEIIETRKKNAAYLNERFKENGAIIPQLLDTDDIQSTYHLYLLQIDPKKANGTIQDLKKKLEERGITNIPHFAPLYKFDVVKKMGYNVDEIQKGCPEAEKVFNERFTHLPLYGLTKGQVDYLADGVLQSVKELQEGK
jgi:perosamine synthetase